MMIITAMFILNWAILTYFEVSFIAILPLMTTAMIWFVCGWKYGREYENNISQKVNDFNDQNIQHRS